jgi:hypothetical protein
VATTEVEDVDGGPPEVLAVGPVAATTEAKDVDGGPPGGGRAGNPGAPTTNAKKRRRWAPESFQS